MKALMVLSVILSLGLFEAKAAPSPDVIRAFNHDFVAALKGEATAPNSPAFRRVAIALKEPKPASVITEGEEICRVRDTARACWKPVWENGRLGLLFRGGRADPFFPAHHSDQKKFRRALTEYFSGTKRTGFLGWLLPVAHAVPLADQEISEFDANLIYATFEGWQKIEKGAEAAEKELREWDPKRLASQRVECQAKNATVTFAAQNAPKKIQRVGENDFRVSTLGLLFKASFVRPSDTKSCRLHWDKSWDEFCALFELPKNVTIQDRKVTRATHTPSGQLLTPDTCKNQYRECSYPIPQEHLKVELCLNDKCTERQPVAGEYALWLGDAPPKAIETLEKLDKEIRKVDSQINALSRDLTSEVASVREKAMGELSGKELNELQGYVKTRKELGEERRERIEPYLRAGSGYSMAKLQKEMADVAYASECCGSNECRKNIYQQKGLDLAPTKGSGNSGSAH